MKNKKIIGLIGGMGPFASARFLQILLEKSSKELKCQGSSDFPEIILDSVPVPDFISDTNNLEISRKMLMKRVKKLSDFGCSKIVMVCNTGHILFPELNEVSNNKMISLIDSVRDKVINMNIKNVGLLATPTTIRTNLYTNAFANTGVNILIPNTSLIELAEKAIRDEISGNTNSLSISKIVSLTEKFVNQKKLDAVILGCTELPLVFVKNKSNKMIDCLEVLAERLIQEIN